MTPWTVCSPSGSSVHGILQARILEWVAILFQEIFPPQGSNLCLVSPASAGGFFTTASPGKAFSSQYLNKKGKMCMFISHATRFYFFSFLNLHSSLKSLELFTFKDPN